MVGSMICDQFGANDQNTKMVLDAFYYRCRNKMICGNNAMENIKGETVYV